MRGRRWVAVTVVCVAWLAVGLPAVACALGWLAW